MNIRYLIKRGSHTYVRNNASLSTREILCRPLQVRISDIFMVEGVGEVYAGTVVSGTVSVGERLLLGPTGPDGVFARTAVASVHVARVAVRKASAGQTASFTLIADPVGGSSTISSEVCDEVMEAGSDVDRGGAPSAKIAAPESSEDTDAGMENDCRSASSCSICSGGSSGSPNAFPDGLGPLEESNDDDGEDNSWERNDTEGASIAASVDGGEANGGDTCKLSTVGRNGGGCEAGCVAGSDDGRSKLSPGAQEMCASHATIGAQGLDAARQRCHPCSVITVANNRDDSITTTDEAPHVRRGSTRWGGTAMATPTARGLGKTSGRCCPHCGMKFSEGSRALSYRRANGRARSPNLSPLSRLRVLEESPEVDAEGKTGATRPVPLDLGAAAASTAAGGGGGESPGMPSRKGMVLIEVSSQGGAYLGQLSAATHFNLRKSRIFSESLKSDLFNFKFLGNSPSGSWNQTTSEWIGRVGAS